MKCTVCGNELKEGAKFCKSCGSPVKIGPKIIIDSDKTCPKCGSNVENDKKFCKFCGWDTTIPYVVHADPEPEAESKPRSKGIVLKVFLTILILGILGAGGFLGYRFFINKPDQGDSTSLVAGNENNAENTEDSDNDGIAVNGEESSSIESADETTAAEEETTEASSGWKAEYADNQSCDLDSCLALDAFERVVSSDGEYYFSYPKYLFNNASYSDEDGYYFSYDEDGKTLCYMKVYSVDDPNDDPITFMTAKQKELMARFPNTDYSKNGEAGYGYSYPADLVKKGIGDDGLMQIVVTGWTDASQSFGVYINAANDGKKTYYFEIGYPDSDPTDDYDKWDYVINCVYHLVSFSGSSTDPYLTYEDFIKQ